MVAILVGAGSFTAFGVKDDKCVIRGVFVTRPKGEMKMDLVRAVPKERAGFDVCVWDDLSV